MRSAEASWYGRGSVRLGWRVRLAYSSTQALGDFAEYVEQQQNLRFPASRRAATGAAQDAPAEYHEELDELFDNLVLADTAPGIKLKGLLLASDEASLKKLQDVVAERIDEGMGEGVFEIGYENSGDCMELTVDEWHRAYDRLVGAAKSIRVDCELLLTKNVGSDVEVGSSADKTKATAACSGKLLLRRVPERVEHVIETRIAVVGNGICPLPAARRR